MFQFIFSTWNLAKRLSQLGMVLIIVGGVVAVFFNQSQNTSSLPKESYTSYSRFKEAQTEAKLKEMEAKPETKLAAGLLRGMNCKFAGMFCGDDSKAPIEHFLGSLMGKTSTFMVATLTTPPASGVYYASETLKNIGIVPKTYAYEGIGFAGMKIYQEIWTIFRDISYMIFVIVLIFSGFAIMFQWKIGGKTAVTLENSLVRIVVAMILINFSYAIAGFMIDMMYVAIGLIVSLLGRGLTLSGNPADDAYIADLTRRYLNADTGMIVNSLTGDWELVGGYGGAAMRWLGGLGPIGKVFQAIGSPIAFLAIAWRVAMALIYMVPDVLRWVLSFITMVLAYRLSSTVTGFIGHFLVMPATQFEISLAGFGVNVGNLPRFIEIGIWLAIFGMVLPFILALVLAVVIMGTFFMFFVRIVFLCFFTYVQILLMIMTAPIQLMAGAIPGKNAFADWLKGLLSLLIVFPILVGSFMLARIIATRADLFNIPSNIPGITGTEPVAWAPPFIGSGGITGGIDTQALLFLVGMAIMFMAPEFVKMAKKAIGGSGPPVSFSPGQFFSAAGAVTAIPALFSTAAFWGRFAPQGVQNRLIAGAKKLEESNKGPVKWFGGKARGYMEGNWGKKDSG